MAINFEIGIRLTDKELKTQLKGIQSDLTRAFTVKNSDGGFAKEIAAAATQAKALDKALQAATTNKGISYAQLNLELAKAGTTAGKLTSTLASGGTYFRTSLDQANNALALSNRHVLSLNRTLQEAARVFKQSFKFTVAQTAIRAISTEIRESIQWVTNLNDAVNNIAVVTNKTANQVTAVTEQAIKGSKELRIAAEDYAKGALIFYQQGLNDEEVIRRNEITIKAAKAANQSIDDMSKQLTAIWNTYGMVGEEQLRAASVGAKMAAQTAVDFSDIAQAMQTAAAPAAQMGVEYNQLAAIIATVGDATQQSASIIGNAYKTIFSRFQQLVSDGTDGEVTLGAVSAKLQNLGIQLFDSSGQLKNLGDTINEVGNNWDNWSEEQQLAIAQLVGGTRQYGQFLALMQNFDKYQKNLSSAATETGSTLEQQYTQALDSIESRAENAGEAWHRAFSNLISADEIKGAYSALEKFGEAADNIIKGLGGLPGILSIVSVLLSSKIVPALQIAGKSAMSMGASLMGKQNAMINKDFKESANEIDKNALLSQSDKETALAKNQFSRETAVINEQINSQLARATGLRKTELEMQQQQLKTTQETFSATMSQSQALEQQLQRQLERQGAEDILREDTIGDLQRQEEEQARYVALLEKELQILQAQAKQKNIIRNHPESQGGNVVEEHRYKGTANERRAQNAAYIQDTKNKLGVARDTLTETRVGLSDIGSAEKQEEASIKRLVAAYGTLQKALADYQKQKLAGKTDEAAKSMEKAQLAALKLSDGLSTVQQYSNMTEDELKQYKKMLESLDDNVNMQEVTDQLHNVGNEMMNMATQGENSQQILSQSQQQTIETSQKLGEATGTVAQKMKEQAAAAAMATQYQKATLSEGISLTVQFASAAAMAVNSIKNMWDIWNNPDLTGGEKALQIITSLSSMLMFTLPQFTSIIKKVQEFGRASILASAKKTAMEVAGTTAETAALIGKAKAEEATGAAALKAGLMAQTGWGPLLPIILGITAAVAAAAAAFAFLYGRFQNSRAETQLEDMRAAAEGIAEAEEEAQAKADALRQAIEGYDSAIDKLNECTKGTDEWADALKEVRKQALEVLDTLDDLSADEIRELYTLEDGVVKLDSEKMKQQQEKLDERANSLSYAKSIANVQVDQASQRVDAKRIAGSLRDSPSTGDLVAEGALMGAALGTILPGVGTALGGLIGATSGLVTGIGAAVIHDISDQELGDKIMENIQNLEGKTGQALADELDKLGIHVEAGSQEFIALEKQIIELADSAAAAREQMRLIARIAVDEQLGSAYSDAEKAIAAESVQEKQDDIYNKLMKEMDDTFGKWDDGSDTERQKLIDRYNAAAGTNYDAHSNFSRGFDDERMFGFVDEQGQLVELTAKQVATTIAASEALEGLEADAQKAREALNSMSQAEQDFIATRSLGGATKAEYDQVIAAASKDGQLTQESAEAYFQGIGLSEEAAADYARDLLRAAEIPWDDLIGDLPETLNNIENLTADAAKGISEQYSKILKDGGKDAADFYIDSLNGMTEGLDAEKSKEVLAAITNIDWSQWDAGDQAVEVLRGMNIEVDTSSSNWKNLVAIMRDANNAIVDVEGELEKMQAVMDTFTGMDYGTIVSKEDFENLRNYNSELTKYFTILANGEAQFTGDKLDFAQALQDSQQNTYLELVKSVKENRDELANQLEAGQKILGNREVSDIGKSMADSAGEGYYSTSLVKNQLDFLASQGYDEEQLKKWTDTLVDANGEWQTVSTTTLEEVGAAVASLNGEFEAGPEKIANYNEQISGLYMSYGMMASSMAEAQELAEKALANEGLSASSDEGKKLYDDVVNSGFQNRANTEKWDEIDADEVQEYSDHLQRLTKNMTAAEREAANLSDDLATNAEAAEDVALYTKKMNQGIDKLANGIEDWSSILEDSTASSEEYSSAMADIKNAMSDVLGVSEEFLTDDFILQNMDDIKLAAEGDAEAIDRLAIAAGQDIIMNLGIKDEGVLEQALALHNELTAMIPDIKVGAVLEGDDEFAQKALELLETTAMTADQANAYFRSIGFEPNFEYEEITKEVPGYKTVTVSDEPVMGYYDTVAVDSSGKEHTVRGSYVKESRTYTYQEPADAIKQTFAVPKLTGEDGKPNANISFTKTNAGAMNNYSSSNKGGTRTPGGGTKKTGGGSDNKKDYVNDAKVKKEKPEENRYANIDSAISSLTTTIDKLNAAENDAWGQTKIRNLKALNYEIAKQNQLLAKRLKEARDYYDTDWATVTGNAAINAAGYNASNITRNKDGSINNIEQIKAAVWQNTIGNAQAYENSLIGSTDEAAVKAAQEASEDAQEAYDEAMEALDKLADSVQQYKDTLQNMVDNIREMMSNISAEINERLEFKIKVRDRDLRRLEKLADRWGDIGVINGETDKLLRQQWDTTFQKIEDTVKEVGYTFSHLELLDQAKTEGKGSEAYEKIIDYFTAEMTSAEREMFTKAFDEYLAGNAALPAEFADSLIEMRDNLEDLFESEVDNQLQQLDNIFTRVNEWLDKTFAQWENILDLNDAILDWSDALLEYTGAYEANDLSMQMSVRRQNTAQMAQGGAKLANNIAQHNAYGEAIKGANEALEYIKNFDNAAQYSSEEFLAMAEAAKVSGDAAQETAMRMFASFGAGAQNALETQINEWRSAQQELVSEIVSSQAELLQIAQENIEKEKEMAKKNVGTILNGLFTDLQDLADNYDAVKTEKGLKFDDYDQDYMTNKLQNMYDEFAENAEPAQLEQMVAWQEKLNQYKREIIGYDEEGNAIYSERLEMTQNEYDLLQKEFELEQLKAQWEEAQNNKNTMRLARDASGNYSYIYSGDNSGSDMDSLGQQIADKEYEYKKLLESIQDATMSTTSQIAVELQDTIDGINQYLWEHDEVYRESVKTKISSLVKQLHTYADESERIFDGLAVGVGSFDEVWGGSAGSIITGADNISEHIGSMVKALVGESENMSDPDSSSYLGKVLDAYEYWGGEANKTLEGAMKDLADEEVKDSIPSSFGDIGTKVASVIEQASDMSLATSDYSKFKSNTEELQRQIDLLLNDEKAGSVAASYELLKTATAEDLGAIGDNHNSILFAKIKEYIGTPGEDSDTTVLGRIQKLRQDMKDLVDDNGTALTSITEQFSTWAEQACGKINEVITAIAAYIAKIDEMQNASMPDDPGEPFEYPDEVKNLGDEIDPGILNTGEPSGGGGGNSSPPSTPTYTDQEIAHGIGAAIWIHGGVTSGWKASAEDSWKPRVKAAYGDAMVSAVESSILDWGYTGKYYNQYYVGPGNSHMAYSDGTTFYRDASTGKIKGAYTGGLITEQGVYELAEKGPEIVLNAEDTKNILAAVSMMRQTVAGQLGSLNGALGAQLQSYNSAVANYAPASQQQTVDQQVKIEASFPGVSVAQEIEDALNSLITQAAQYNIKK